MTDNPTLESKLRAWIDNYYSEMAERPQMFAATPQTLESIVWILEAMRHELLAVAPASSEHPYQAFLSDKGFGSASFTSRGGGEACHIRQNSSVTFEEFVHFLQEYLESQGRLPRQMDKEAELRQHQKKDTPRP